MKFPTPALITALAAPSMIDAWSPHFALTTRPTSMMDFLSLSPSSILRQQDALLDRGAFRQASPRYKITDSEDAFQIAVDVPGMKAEDINVSVENDGQVLSINGKREASGDTYKFSSEFSQSFYLGDDVELEKFTANLDNGVLVISAPKDVKKLEEGTRSIPVTQEAAKEEKAAQVEQEKVEDEKTEENVIDLDAKTETAEEPAPAAA